MDISFSSMFLHDSPLGDIFRAPHCCGADSLEFWLETPDFWLKGLKLEVLMDILKENTPPSPLSVHAPVLDLNPCSINPDIREVSIRWIERSIQFTEAIGGSVCTIHPGRRTAKRPPSITDYQRLGSMLDTIRPLAESVQAKVAIENMEPAVNALLTTPDEVMGILEEYPWLWFTFDVAHAMRLGPDTAGLFLKMGRERLANIHISGINGTIIHGPVTDDQMVTSFLTQIKKSGYNGQVTLELNDLVLQDMLNYESKLKTLRNEISTLRMYLQ